MVEREVTVRGKAFHIVVTGSLDEVLRLVGDFRGQTLIVLSAVGIMLAVMSFIVARIALRPIGKLGKAIERVREGRPAPSPASYPREIAPLAEEVNELLRSNAQIIERARNQVGNLAHGLKTPLAVLRNEAAGNKSAARRGGAHRDGEDDARWSRAISTRPASRRGPRSSGARPTRPSSCCGWPG